MNRKIVGMVISIIAVALIAFVVVLALRQNAPENPTVNDTTENEQSENSGNSNSKSDTGASNSGDPQIQSVEAEVEIEGVAFQPTEITVKRGTVVTWTNKDNVQHDVTSDEGVQNGPQSGLLNKAQTYKFTFNETGTFTYHCSLHPQMKGTVKVVE